MKYIILLLLTFIVISCNSYKLIHVEESISIKDTITIPDVHEHYCDNKCYCIYIEGYTFEEEDTLYIDYYLTKKKWKQIRKKKY